MTAAPLEGERGEPDAGPDQEEGAGLGVLDVGVALGDDDEIRSRGDRWSDAMSRRLLGGSSESAWLWGRVALRVLSSQ